MTSDTLDMDTVAEEWIDAWTWTWLAMLILGAFPERMTPKTWFALYIGAALYQAAIWGQPLRRLAYRLNGGGASG